VKRDTGIKFPVQAAAGIGFERNADRLFDQREEQGVPAGAP